MIDSHTIDQTLVSNLPYSMERMADIIRKAMKFYPELKNRFLVGDQEEQKRVKMLALIIVERIDDEMQKTCKHLNLRVEMFQNQIISYFSLPEALLYKESFEFIQAHHNELFQPIKLKKRDSFSKPKIKSSHIQV